MGKAYGFFGCSASKQAIEAELPKIRSLAQTPSALELTLTEEVDHITGDPTLVHLAHTAKKNGSNYYIEATCDETTNRETAEELGMILNQAYKSPLYTKNEPFRGDVVYQENGHYLSLR